MHNDGDNEWILANLSFEDSKCATEFCLKSNDIAFSACVEHDENLICFSVHLSRKPF